MEQLSIFDFIEDTYAPPAEKASQLTLFEKLFPVIKNPVFQCANCLCNYCTHNAEGVVKKEEFTYPCFNCDECRIFDGDSGKSICRKHDCEEFDMSERGAERNRKEIKLIK